MQEPRHMMPPRCELTRQLPFLILTLIQIGTTGHTQTAGKLLNVDCVGRVDLLQRGGGQGCKFRAAVHV